MKPAYVEGARIICVPSRPSTDNPYNVLDWRDRGSYPEDEKLCLAEWRWEFVRRSCAYRKFWEGVTNSYPNLDAEPEVDYWLADFNLNKVIDPRLRAGEFDADLLKCDYSMAYWIGGWGVDHPEADRTSDLEETDRIIAEISKRLSAGATLEEVDTLLSSRPRDEPIVPFREFIDNVSEHDVVLVAIRPDLPLKRQLNAIEKLVSFRLQRYGYGLKEQRSEQKVRKIRREKHQKYLRILDARDEQGPFKSSWNEISKVLSSEEAGLDPDRVRELYDQAKETQKKLFQTPMAE